ncbi:MAG: hypothetical protein ACR2LI_13175 [Propionibacteriaceae bacterium]
MGGTATRRLAVLAGFALATALVGCSTVSDRQNSSPEPTGPTRPVPTADPNLTSPPTTETGPVSSTWDIRYLEDGQLKVLKVEDFPR